MSGSQSVEVSRSGSATNSAGQALPYETATPRYSAWLTVAVFLIGSLLAGATVAGPGLSWDEPAYRHSQVTLQQWLDELASAENGAEIADLVSADSIHHYWEYNRFGHNFHPPMGGYLNLLTYWTMGGVWDDISARRLASALEFAATAAILCHFLGRRYGASVGLFAAFSLLTMPRLMGQAHLIDTDIPLTLFWTTTALALPSALASRRWQWLLAVSWACLFLVKFSGVVIAAPLAIWFVGSVLVRQPRRSLWTWLRWTLVIALPLAPLAITLLFGAAAAPLLARQGAISGVDRAIASWGMEHSRIVGLLFLWPLVALGWFRIARRKSDPVWNVALELPWVVLAVTPLVCIALNPTWWHDPVRSLAQYFDLNLNRQGHLPDIGIFYLGQRYLYSLPWHNAYVLMAVTIPFGTLLLGMVGLVRSFAMWRTDCVGVYFVLQAFTLPAIRMLPTPAHDGVRLFLPTFVFWAGLAALGAAWIVGRISQHGSNGPKDPSPLPLSPEIQGRGARARSNSPCQGGPPCGKRTLAWTAMFLVGPVWAGWQWARIHPYELSYYNVGLPRAMDWGFEPTYWYDALTPKALASLNECMPANVAVGLPDPLINPETFTSLQHLGRLRGDVRLDLTGVKGFGWVWLLTHSSKATAFTRLLYACKPWSESGVEGVRLFSVVDSDSVALAWGLLTLTVESGQTSKLGPLVLYEPIFSMSAADMRRAVALIEQHGAAARQHVAGEPTDVGDLIRHWTSTGAVDGNLQRLLAVAPLSLDRAIEILTTRPDDVRSVLVTPGYQRPEKFGGYFEP